MLTPWWKAGWTIADIIHAINVNPDGVPWNMIPLSKITNVGAWVASRLGHWADEQGVPTLSPSQRQARADHRRWSAEQQRREELARADALSVVLGQGPAGKVALAEYREQAGRTPAEVQRAAQQRRDAAFRERIAARTAPAATAPVPAERPEGVTPLEWARAQAEAARVKSEARGHVLAQARPAAIAPAPAPLVDDWTPPQDDPAELEAARAAIVRARALARVRAERRNR